jgi:glycosyltransferase involved in cell wall biosynthesis
MSTHPADRSDDNLSVLIVIDRIEDIGGAEQSTALVIRGLHERGVHVAAIGLDGITLTDRSELEAGGVRFFEPASRGTVAAIRCVRSAVAAIRPDIVHATLARSELAARLAGLVAGVPVMTSIVNDPYGPEARAVASSGPKLAAYRAIDQVLSRSATFAFHAITDATAAAAVRSLGIDPDRIIVVPRGRDEARLGARTSVRRDAARSDLGIATDAFVILNVAREDRQKGQSALLDALARTRATSNPVIVVIAGRRGSASVALDEQVERLGLGNRVLRLGPRLDVPELLCAADLFAFPSLYEGLGGALIEAMAMSVPIVAFDTPAVHEAVGDAARLVAPSAVGAFTAAIDEFVSDDARRADYAARGRARFEARFTADTYVGAMVECYQTIVERAHRDFEPARAAVIRRVTHPFGGTRSSTKAP